MFNLPELTKDKYMMLAGNEDVVLVMHVVRI
jgi:hypothetical protein